MTNSRNGTTTVGKIPEEPEIDEDLPDET